MGFGEPHWRNVPRELLTRGEVWFRASENAIGSVVCWETAHIKPADVCGSRYKTQMPIEG